MSHVHNAGTYSGRRDFSWFSIYSGNYKYHHRSALSPISPEGKWRYPWVGGGSKAAGVAHEVWAQACISLMTNQAYFCSLCLVSHQTQKHVSCGENLDRYKWNLRDTKWIQTVGCGQTAWLLKEFTTGRTETVCSNWGWPYTKSFRQLSLMGRVGEIAFPREEHPNWLFNIQPWKHTFK